MVRSKTNRVITKALYHVVCLLLCVVMLYPLLWMVFSSFKETSAVFTTAANLFPERWTVDNYINGWRGFLGTSFGTFFNNDRGRFFFCHHCLWLCAAEVPGIKVMVRLHDANDDAALPGTDGTSISFVQ